MVADPIAGHIPGAECYPWEEGINEAGFILLELAHIARWKSLPLQARTTLDIIVYCGSGVSACVNILSLIIAGKERVHLYPGSWSDWCSFEETEKTTLSQGKQK